MGQRGQHVEQRFMSSIATGERGAIVALLGQRAKWFNANTCPRMLRASLYDTTAPGLTKKLLRDLLRLNLIWSCSGC